MPRFEPSVAEAYRLLPKTIVTYIFDGGALDEERLSRPTRMLLALVKLLTDQGVTKRELLEKLSALQAGADDKIEATLKQYFDGTNLRCARVLCVTTNCENDAMWGNYGESHAGCVLGFRHIERLSTPLLEARQVIYSEARPVVGSGLDFLLYGNCRELEERTLNAVCFTKKSTWSYEEEWRAVTWRPEEVNKHYADYRFYPDELESVTLGARTSSATEIKVRELLAKNYPTTSLYRMNISKGDLVRNPVL